MAMEARLSRQLGMECRGDDVALPHGDDDESLLARALEQRLVFVIGSAFYVDGSGHDRIRLSFSAPSPDRIREGARRLAAAIKPARGSPLVSLYS
jgi:DNA-binding transcriptional MocR family regulator